MSTSPSRAPVPGIPQAGFNLQPFPYETIAVLKQSETLVESEASPEHSANDSAAEARALAQTRLEAQAEARKIFEAQIVKERATLAAALSQFTRDRAAYFQKVEGEIVQLSLAIARKILHRESQVDPLLLAGIVRVALEQIDRATGVRLHVHPQNSADWQRYFSLHLQPSDVPELVEDPSLSPDQCTLETAMGSAVLGIEVQLKEIEQGLMDLLAARPETIS